jgi:hypothetical protein
VTFGTEPGNAAWRVVGKIDADEVKDAVAGRGTLGEVRIFCVWRCEGSI